MGRLPEKYRLVLVLCDLEGRTRKDVARHLALPEGTVASRPATARAMLAKRLSRRGVVVSGVLLGVVLASRATADAAPAAVVSTATRTATPVASGHAAGAGSPTVAALTTGVVNAMSLSKIKTAAVALVLGLNFDIPGGGYGRLKELKHLRVLTFMMTNVADAELELLEEALPATRTSAATGGGGWTSPKRKR